MSKEKIDDLNRRYNDAAAVIFYLDQMRQLIVHRISRTEEAWKLEQSGLHFDFSMLDVHPTLNRVPDREHLAITNNPVMEALLRFDDLMNELEYLQKLTTPETRLSHTQLSQDNRLLRTQNQQLQDEVTRLNALVKDLQSEKP